jgi:hypothetical protein
MCGFAFSYDPEEGQLDSEEKRRQTERHFRIMEYTLNELGYK